MSQHIDPLAWSVLFDLHLETGGQLLPELYLTFEETWPPRLEQMKKEWSQKNGAALATSFHFLKSLVGNFGALHLVGLLNEAENCAEKEDWEALQSIYESIFSDFLEFREELKALISMARTA